MKKAIVTGANGFIGRFLVRELVRQKVEVVAVVRRGTKNKSVISDLTTNIVECDLSEVSHLPELISARDIDVIFHLAWRGISDQDARDERIQLANVQSALSLIDAAQRMQIHTFVGAGSIHEAELLVEMKAGRPVENMGLMYKVSKTAAHWMGKTKAGQLGMRFFWPWINTYGEEERSGRLINTVIRKIYNEETPLLSSAEQFYDFVHVSDVAHCLYLIAEKGVNGKDYVIGSGAPSPLKDYLTVVGEIANRIKGGTKIPLGFGRVHTGVISLPRDTFDTTELIQDTGFTPAVSFREGVERTARWLLENDKADTR